MIDEFAPGSMFDARYEILHQFGSGGMGRVCKARELELNSTVAIKTRNLAPRLPLSGSISAPTEALMRVNDYADSPSLRKLAQRLEDMMLLYLAFVQRRVTE